MNRQKFIRTTQWIFIIFGFVLFFYHPSFLPVYYRPRLMGTMAVLYSFFIQLPLLIFRAPPRSSAAADVERLQVGLSIWLLLNGLGSLGLWGLYQVGISYDKFVHFIFPVLVIVPGFSLVRSLYGWSSKKALITLVLLICVSAVAWEYAEYASARWLHFGFFGQLFDQDSILDILYTCLGAGAAALFLTTRTWFTKN